MPLVFAVTACAVAEQSKPEVSMEPKPTIVTASPAPSTWPSEAEKTAFIRAVSDTYPIVSESQSSVDAVVAAGIEVCATLDEISNGTFSDNVKVTVTAQTVERLSAAATLGLVESTKIAPIVVVEAVKNFCPDQTVTVG